MSKIFHGKDKKTWPEDWPEVSVEPDSVESEKLTQVIYKISDKIHVYHACRPIDPSTYYRDGLKIPVQEELLKQAIDIFSNGQFQEISEDDVILAESKMEKPKNHRVYFALDDRHLEEYCGHYLIYGSEYISGIAAILSGFYGPDYSQDLKKIGIPTIFEVHLPVSWIDESILAELVSEMAIAIFEDNIASQIDFTITLHNSVPPEFIHSHHHPKQIIDPILERTTYIYDDNLSPNESK